MCSNNLISKFINSLISNAERGKRHKENKSIDFTKGKKSWSNFPIETAHPKRSHDLTWQKALWQKFKYVQRGFKSPMA